MDYEGSCAIIDYPERWQNCSAWNPFKAKWIAKWLSLFRECCTVRQKGEIDCLPNSFWSLQVFIFLETFKGQHFLQVLSTAYLPVSFDSAFYSLMNVRLQSSWPSIVIYLFNLLNATLFKWANKYQEGIQCV